MKNKYDFSTKDKVENSYREFILSILLNLGFRATCRGTFYLRDLILIAIMQTDISENDISLKRLILSFSKLKNIPSAIIKTNIEYTFKNIDIEKAEKNFNKIFNLEYDIYFITPKSIISLIVSLILN